MSAGSTIALAANWLRAFVTNNVPSSGVNNPLKSDGITVFGDIENRLTGLESASFGVNYTTAARFAITGTLPAYTYANGTAGVGATITANSNGALSSSNCDGLTPSTADRCWVWNAGGAGAVEYGLYAVTQVGDGSHPFILTRVTDADSAAELGQRAASVTAGSTLSGVVIGVSQTGPNITVGTTALICVIIASQQAVATEAARAEAAEAAISAQLPVLTPAIGFFGGEPTIGATADTNGNLIAISTRTQDFRRGESGLSPVGPTLLKLDAPVTGSFAGVGQPHGNVCFIVVFIGQSNAEGVGDPLDPLCAPVATSAIYSGNALMLSPAVRLRVRNSGTDLPPQNTPIGQSLISLVEAADSTNQTYETAASGCVNQIISEMFSATYGPVTTINANGTWTTSSTTINMYEQNPQSVSAGMQVVKQSTGQTIGTVSTYVGNTLTLTSAAAVGSTTSGDTLQFYSGTLLSVAGMVAAHGSNPIAKLKRGTPTYNWLLRGARDLCGAIFNRKQRPVFICVDVNVTESDTSSGTPPHQYSASLLGVVRSLNDDLKSISGQANDLVFTVTAPEAPEASIGYQNVLFGQRMAAQRDPRIVLSQGVYDLPRANQATIAAAGAFTTASPNITMAASNPGWIVSGTLVYDATNGQNIGTVSTYSGTALVLQANAAHASNGSSDSLIFSGANTIHYSAAGRDLYGIKLGKIIVDEVFGTGHVPMLPDEVYFSDSVTIKIRWPFQPTLDTSNALVNSANMPAGGWGGFYFDDGSGSAPTITGGSNSGIITTLTLSAAPTGTNKRLRYAMLCNAGEQQGNYNDFGPQLGARGWIRANLTATTNFYNSAYPAYLWARPFIWEF